MKVLVTGSSGFVGKRLCTALEERGHKARKFSRKEGGDLLDPKKIDIAVRGVDAVVHLAAQVDEEAKDLFKVNVEGTKNLLKACEKGGIEHFIYLSSCGVMGDIHGKVDESAPYKPKTRYEKSKMLGEQAVLSYQEVMHVTVLRSAIVYGENKYWGQLFSYVKNGKPMIGSGGNKWQMVYVDDLVDAIIFVLGNEEASGEVYIVAEEGGETLEEIYLEIGRLVGVSEKPVKSPLALARAVALVLWAMSKLTRRRGIITPSHIERAVRIRDYDISKIKKLGWKPKYGTKKGLKKTFGDLNRDRLN